MTRFLLRLSIDTFANTNYWEWTARLLPLSIAPGAPYTTQPLHQHVTGLIPEFLEFQPSLIQHLAQPKLDSRILAN